MVSFQIIMSLPLCWSNSILVNQVSINDIKELWRPSTSCQITAAWSGFLISCSSNLIWLYCSIGSEKPRNIFLAYTSLWMFRNFTRQGVMLLPLRSIWCVSSPSWPVLSAFKTLQLAPKMKHWRESRWLDASQCWKMPAQTPVILCLCAMVYQSRAIWPAISPPSAMEEVFSKVSSK